MFKIGTTLVLCILWAPILNCEKDQPPDITGTFYYQPEEKLYTVTVDKLSTERFQVTGIGSDAVYLRTKNTLTFSKEKQHVKLVFNPKNRTFMVYISRSKVGRIYANPQDVVSFEKQNSTGVIRDSWKKKME